MSVKDVDPRLVAALTRQLAGRHGDRGDRVITGSVVQTPVELGDDVTADFGELGRVTLKLA